MGVDRYWDIGRILNIDNILRTVCMDERRDKVGIFVHARFQQVQEMVLAGAGVGEVSRELERVIAMMCRYWIPTLVRVDQT